MRFSVRALAACCVLTLPAATPLFARQPQKSPATPAIPSAPAPAAVDGAEGIWVGALVVNGGIKLRLVFHVTRGADGALAATLDSPDQGANGIPVTSVVRNGDKIVFTLAAIGGTYEGSLDAGRTKMIGSWSQGGASLPLALERSETGITVVRSQEPKGPLPYDAEDVTFENAGAKLTLAGTFTSPKGDGPFAAVVLVSGSGPQDRDESLLGHKPFLVLADYLTRRGIAVLRFDDRGTAKSTGAYGFDQTAADFATDGQAAVAYLKTRRDVDPKRIGVIGHSEGGLAAPIAAAADHSIAFVVMMAGPGTVGNELLASQSALVARAMGDDEPYDKIRADALRMFAVIAAEKDDKVALEKLRALRAEEVAKLDEAKRAKAATEAAQWDQAMQMMLTPYIRYFLAYDPRPTLSKVKCPVLAINGELDLQVPAGENLLGIATSLEAGGNRDYTLVKLPGLNHLFQTAKTGAPSEYGSIDETFSPAALRTIGDWVEARFGDKR